MDKKTISENLQFFGFPENKIEKFTKIIYRNRHLGIYFINPLYQEMPLKSFSGILILPDSIAFYKNGDLHREDGPAVYFINGSKYWYVDNILHRDNGPAEKVYLEKEYYKSYYNKGRLHREDGPAIVFYKIKDKSIITKEWFQNNERHREDGPAVIIPRKKKKPKKHYYINGQEISKNDFKQYNKFDDKISSDILSVADPKKNKK